MQKLYSITLIDVQSWEGKEELTLSPHRVTVLKAPSETGKSVLTNFLVDFVAKDYTAEVFNSLVRKGSDSCGVLFKYEDNSTLLLYMAKEVKAMMYTGANGEQEDYIAEQINEISLQRFGIIVDDKNDMLVNVFSRNTQLLLVDTDEFFNGALLSRVLVDRQVERIQDYLKEQELQLKDMIKEVSPVREKLEYQQAILPYTNLEVINTGIKKTRMLSDFFNKAYSVERRLQAIKSTNDKKLSVIDIDLSELQDLRKSLVVFDRIRSCLLGIPQQKSCLEGRILEEMQELKSSMLAVRGLGSLMSTVNGLKKYRQGLDEERLSMEIVANKIAVLQRVLDLKEDLGDLIVESENADNNLEHLELELHEQRRLIKICPICGGKL